MNIAQY